MLKFGSVPPRKRGFIFVTRPGGIRRIIFVEV